MKPMQTMEVEKDQLPQANRNWMTMQRWLNVANDKGGVTMCSLDAPLIEYGNMTANITKEWSNEGPWIEKCEPSSTIYSWVMNNHWFTNFPLTQDGPVTFRYRIMMHNTPYNSVAANRFGMEQARPLIHVATNQDPHIQPLIALNNPKVYTTIIKSLDDYNKETIIRLRSLSDKNEKVTLSFPREVKSISVCNVAEEKGEQVNGEIEMLPFGIKTLRIKF